MPWLFLLAYACSGIAGLIYEVSWTRLLTLHIGHTTAAAAAVVAAFLGGLALGAARGGDVASRLARRTALGVYVGLEVGVALVALAFPLAVRALTPLLSWAYGDDGAGWWFPLVRLGSCLLLVFVPALALGATFPMAIRWFAHQPGRAARLSGTLYAVNTAGAAVGALLAGFVLIPAIGISGATQVGVAASLLAAGAVLVVLRADTRADERDTAAPASIPAAVTVPGHMARGAVVAPPTDLRATDRAVWLAAGVLGLSGFASLMHEIAWTRILVLVLGPTTYAFAATLAAVIGGVAIGSALGTTLMGRARQPAVWLAATLALAALTTSYTYSLAGQRIPSLVAKQMASAADPFAQLLRQGLVLTALLILPTAVCLGAAFPMALALAGSEVERAAGRFGRIYAVNTIGAVTGSLASGFLFIPTWGLERTLQVVSGCLVGASLVVVFRATAERMPRLAGAAAAMLVAGLVLTSPPWDRELLASGPYMYAPFVPADLDLDTQLRAGQMLYYREGASATVSVKKLTGTTTLAVDGKTDASNRGDMLTQTLIAHLPLLLHPQPREVAIVGLGSGVTVGSALRHPITRADVVEISPEVVDASRFFETENQSALADPRTRLIIGDGRSHLLLTPRRYDVIISEPSNPWIAGVAALFTREFFEATRARLAPGGVMCQWANAYNISDADLRAIVATFLSVFPYGTVWLVGGDDVLMVASDAPLDDRLAALAATWQRPGVADDLARVSVVEPFSVLSLYVGGPAELAPYAAGAPLLTDDTMRLEFSAPRELHQRRATDNGATLLALRGGHAGPPALRQALAEATAAQWRNRGAMLARSDVFTRAQADYLEALRLDLGDAPALDGLVRTATITGRAAPGLDALNALVAAHAPADAVATAHVLVARSRLQAATGNQDAAIASAREASGLVPAETFPLEQLATLYADTANTVPLDGVVAELTSRAPTRAATWYFAAAAAFLHGQPDQAVTLAERALVIDPDYAATYDLAGAAYTKLGRVDEARAAFERSLTFDAHDSTAYTNLGLLALEAGALDAARGYFAEALWLVPDSRVAREGLARTR